MDLISELRDRNVKLELGDNICSRAANELEASFRSAGIMAERIRDQDDEIERLRALAIALAEDYSAAVGSGGPNSRVNQALAMRSHQQSPTMEK